MSAKKVDRNLNWHLRTWSLGFVFRSLFPTKVMGRENIPDGEAFVFAIGPHKTYKETVLVPAYLSKIEFHIMAKDSLFRIPVFGMIFRNAGGIPVVRTEGRGVDSIDPAVIELLKGFSVMVYPEGTHHGNDDLMHIGKTGAIRIALKAGVRIIPIGLEGMRGHYSDTKRVIRIGTPFDPRVEMSVMQRINVNQSLVPDGKMARQLTDRLMNIIAKLSGIAQGDEQGNRA